MMEQVVNSLLEKEFKKLQPGLTEDEMINKIKCPKPQEIISDLFALLDKSGCNPMNQSGNSKMYALFYLTATIFWMILIVGYNFCYFTNVGEFVENFMYIGILMQIIQKFLIRAIYSDDLLEIINVLFNIFWRTENLITPAKRIYVAYSILLDRLILLYRIFFRITLIILILETLYSTPGKPFTKVWHPERIDFNNKQPYAVCFLLAQLLTFTRCVVLTIVPYDILFILLTANAYIQMECLKCTIENVDCTDKHRATQTLNKCVEHHNLLLNYLKRIESIYSISLMSQLSSCIASTCCAIFLFMNCEGFILRSCLYIGLSIVQLLIYCFGGQMITDQTASLADSAFESNWWMLPDKNFRRGIALIIQRSQREVNISAGGVYILSMDLFMKVVRLSVSFMTLLQNSIDK